MKKLFFSICLVASIGSVFVSCKKDKDEDPAPVAVTAKKPGISAKAKAVAVPAAMSQSSDPYAAQTVGYVNQVNSVSNYSAFFEPPANATVSHSKSTTTTYTWTLDGATITLVYQETATKYLWSITLNGSYYGQTYNNYTYLTAEEALDGTSGRMDYYDISGANSIYWEWQIIGNTASYTCVVAGMAKYTVNVNADGSGEVNYYTYETDWQLFYNMTWDTLGNGTWAFYTDGSVAESGSWIV